MIRRRTPLLGRRPGVPRPALLVRGLAAAAIASLPVLAPLPAAAAPAPAASSAQDTPPTSEPPAPPAITPPSAVGISDEVVNRAAASFGFVDAGKESGTGWIAGNGLVATSSSVVSRVGTGVTFQTVGSSNRASCYLAKYLPELSLSLLRCADLEGRTIDVEPRYSVPGTAVFVISCSRGDGNGANVTIRTEGGTVVDNDVDFMNERRVRLSFTVRDDTDTTTVGLLDSKSADGSAVLNAEGKVITTVLTAPVSGGQPIGITPGELRDSIDEGLRLPASFGSAAVLTAGRRALIPSGVGLVLGLLWGLRARNGTTFVKCLGGIAIGIVGAVAYTFFAALVVGPETLIG